MKNKYLAETMVAMLCCTPLVSQASSAQGSFQIRMTITERCEMSASDATRPVNVSCNPGSGPRAMNAAPIHQSFACRALPKPEFRPSSRDLSSSCATPIALDPEKTMLPQLPSVPSSDSWRITLMF